MVIIYDNGKEKRRHLTVYATLHSTGVMSFPPTRIFSRAHSRPVLGAWSMEHRIIGASAASHSILFPMLVTRFN